MTHNSQTLSRDFRKIGFLLSISQKTYEQVYFHEILNVNF
jgi:hypothetical protein